MLLQSNHKKKEISIVWEAQEGPQSALIACPVFEVFFGGARGGGKTEASIGDWLGHSSQYGRFAVGLFVRRTLTQLSEVIARTKQLFPLIGAKYNEKKAEWTMPGGARLKFAYLERDEDAASYQGHSYTRIYIEEATDFPSPDPIFKLKATLRSAAGVPTGMRLTGNPGGPGHTWVKHRYIDPAPRGYKIISEEETLEIDGKKITVKLDRVFIPSKLTDNKLLMRNDPTYTLKLKQSGSAALVKAWLKGDWDIVDGAFFSQFDPEKHILPSSFSLLIPKKALRFRAFDWGSAKPFSVGWYAISDGTWGLPKEALFKYREWYGASGINKGLGMTDIDVAKGIKEMEKGEIIKYGVADPAIFIRNGGPSIAERMSQKKCSWRAADNKRLPGWEMLRYRLAGEGGIPMLYFSEECVDTIRTLPIVQHDKKRAEDLDTNGEDHAVDETRYAVMSRPWLPSNIEVIKSYRDKNLLDCTIDEIVAQLTEKRKSEANYDR